MAPMPSSYSHNSGASRGLISKKKNEENKLPEASGGARRSSANRGPVVVNNRSKPTSFTGSRGIVKGPKSNPSGISNGRVGGPSSFSNNRAPVR